MVEHKHIDKICIGAAGLAALLTLLLWLAAPFGTIVDRESFAYETRLFDDSRVHTVDIQLEDWDAFLREAQTETYVPCTVEIDGEAFPQVGLRTKGNNSLRLTGEYGLSRYSLKLEFDQYLDGGNYYGLDKFSLDASFQDNSYLKTYLAYDMMAFMGVPAPLCSYVWVTVNGEDWGLFLAVEEPEDAFARRNFGSDYGRLYKPDYRSLQAENADVALQYIDDNPESYPGIFENAKLPTTQADQKRLIASLKQLSEENELETVVAVEEVLRYFAVQVFVMNWDSYLGHTGHNYILYEENGVLQMLPWDYNLAFGTYALGMTDPIRDPNVLINYPINTPAEGKYMQSRPLYHNLMKQNGSLALYHGYFDELLSNYFENGRFAVTLRQTAQMISPYVQKDPTAFCTFADHQLAVDTLEKVCLLRAQSIRGQLSGTIPATIRGQQEQPNKKLDASDIVLEHLGDFADLEYAKPRQDAALDEIRRKEAAAMG